MLKRSIPDVEFSARDVGLAVAGSSDHTQRQVLLAWARGVDEMNRQDGAWESQCRAIVDGITGRGGLSAHDRKRIASFLGVLVDCLQEPVPVRRGNPPKIN